MACRAVMSFTSEKARGANSYARPRNASPQAFQVLGFLRRNEHIS